MILAAFIPMAFLLGSIPTGLLIARAGGVDIRAHGSGNIGATNVWRVMGRGPGMLCFALDALKGLAPTLGAGLASGLAGALAPPPTQSALWLAVAGSAILGHMHSPWIGFRGGKGVATGLGALLGVYPLLTWPAIGALVIWIVVARLTRIVSISSITAALAIPLLAVVGAKALGTPHTSALPYYIALLALATLVIYKHRANIRRLISGTENRIGVRTPPVSRTHDAPASPQPHESSHRHG